MRAPRGVWLAGLALLLPACTAPVRSFGALTTLPASGDGSRTFSLAPGERADADVAVRDALLAAGYRPSTDARYRIEVGFAVRAPRIDVLAVGEGHDMRPLAPVSRPPGLCRRQSYVLSIAFVDQASGRVAARGAAVTSRCGRAPGTGLLPALARAALSGGGAAS